MLHFCCAFSAVEINAIALHTFLCTLELCAQLRYPFCSDALAAEICNVFSSGVKSSRFSGDVEVRTQRTGVTPQSVAQRAVKSQSWAGGGLYELHLPIDLY